MKKLTVEHPTNSVEIGFLGTPNTPDGYTVKIRTTPEGGMEIEVERSHGEEASSWDSFSFEVAPAE